MSARTLEGGVNDVIALRQLHGEARFTPFDGGKGVIPTGFDTRPDVLEVIRSYPDLQHRAWLLLIYHGIIPSLEYSGRDGAVRENLVQVNEENRLAGGDIANIHPELGVWSDIAPDSQKIHVCDAPDATTLRDHYGFDSIVLGVQTVEVHCRQIGLSHTSILDTLSLITFLNTRVRAVLMHVLTPYLDTHGNYVGIEGPTETPYEKALRKTLTMVGRVGSLLFVPGPNDTGCDSNFLLKSNLAKPADPKKAESKKKETAHIFPTGSELLLRQLGWKG